MKVCMTHYAFYPTTGGVESHLLDLCTELAEQGHKVHALVGSMKGCKEEEELKGFRIYRCDWMNPEIIREKKHKLGYKEDQVSVTIQAEIEHLYREFLRDHDIDVVHAHNFHHFLPEYGMALTELRREGWPTFLTIHEMWGEFLCTNMLQKTEWDAIIAVGEHVRRQSLQQVPELKDKNLVLIHHGIDTEMFSPDVSGDGLRRELGLEGRRVILHPARFLPWKGVIYSVEAMRRIKEEFPEALLIVTDTEDIVDWINELGDYKKEVLRKIVDWDLEDNILKKPFDFYDLPQAYAMSEIVIYPTCGEEPFGLVPLEAMACKRPVIVTKSGGLVESVLDGKTGYIIEKENSDQLAEKMIHLLRNPEIGREFGERGRLHVEENFSRVRMAKEVIELYESALAAKESKPEREHKYALT